MIWGYNWIVYPFVFVQVSFVSRKSLLTFISYLPVHPDFFPSKMTLGVLVQFDGYLDFSVSTTMFSPK